MTDTTKTQPTILVKKADGTTERITLAEFRLRKQGKPIISQIPGPQTVSEVQSSSRLSRDKVQAPARRAIPLVEENTTDYRLQTTGNTQQLEKKQELSPSSVVRRPIPLVEEKTTDYRLQTTDTKQPENTPHRSPSTVVRRQSQPITSHQSLLEEDDSELNELKKKTIPHAPATVSFSSSVVIPKDLEARTNSLILSWKKGIRDKHQFLDYAAKPTSEGGLGLSRGNAEKLFSEISENATLSVPVIPARLAPRPIVPAPTPQKKSQMQHIPNPTSLIREIAPRTETSTVMGPAEEAAAFTLEDFRRLSRDPKVAGSMLIAKFSGWKDESYLLYLQVRDSWRVSPLFRLYIEETVDALEKNIPLVSALQGSTVGYDEYLAIAEVNRKIGRMD